MAIVLLSGGLDSAFNLAKAAGAGVVKLALSFDYGQRAVLREMEAARALAEHYHVRWQKVSLPWLGEVSHSSLNKIQKELPKLELDQLDSLEHVIPSMQSVWVPNRNGVFLNAAAAWAEATGSEQVLVGFNREEASTFPDNSEGYLNALNEAFAFSTLTKVKVHSYSLHMDKTEILREAIALDMPLDLVWSCYEAGPRRCGRCESCRRTERGLLENGEAGSLWRKKLFGATV